LKKSGSQTVSHLRFGPQPIRAPYLVQQASFVGCHHFGLLDRVDVLGLAAPGATLLLDCTLPADEVWDALPRPVFETLPVADRSRVDFGTVRGTQFLQPLFEFSGACAGCGGNLPTTPWTTNADGRGPAWSNSLFEDNAEFGLGFGQAPADTTARSAGTPGRRR